MRIWSLHPRYLDAQGLVALWRETLLAREVLRGNTRGYRNHPQLERFSACISPVRAVNGYLCGVYDEAQARGYAFDRSKLARAGRGDELIPVTEGQLDYEWRWLLAKLEKRSPRVYEQNRRVSSPELHPIFLRCPGPVARWERVAETA